MENFFARFFSYNGSLIFDIEVLTTKSDRKKIHEI